MPAQVFNTDYSLIQLPFGAIVMLVKLQFYNWKRAGIL